MHNITHFMMFCWFVWFMIWLDVSRTSLLEKKVLEFTFCGAS